MTITIGNPPPEPPNPKPVLQRLKEEQARYWQERGERNILQAEKTAYEMLTQLQQTYDYAERQLVRELESFYGRYARETGLELSDARRLLSERETRTVQQDADLYYSEVERLGLDPEYARYLRTLSAKSNVSRLEALQFRMRNEVENMYGLQQQAFTNALSTAYLDSYYMSTYAVQRGVGFSSLFTAPNLRVVEKAVSQKWLGDNYSDRIWRDKARLLQTLETVIPQGIALGHNPNRIAREIASATNTHINNATRLARTEHNNIANEATNDAYVESGIVHKYQILATLDGRTSVICQDMDLQIFNLSDKMTGVNYPPLHPNCRSTTIPYFEPNEKKKLYDTSQRIARDPKGKSYYVPADLTYKQWFDGLTAEAKLEMKKTKNLEADKKQMKKYKSVVGNLTSLKSIKAFQEAKYDEVGAYKQLQKAFRDGNLKLKYSSEKISK